MAKTRLASDCCYTTDRQGRVWIVRWYEKWLEKDAPFSCYAEDKHISFREARQIALKLMNDIEEGRRSIAQLEALAELEPESDNERIAILNEKIEVLNKKIDIIEKQVDLAIML